MKSAIKKVKQVIKPVFSFRLVNKYGSVHFVQAKSINSALRKGRAYFGTQCTIL